MEQERFIIAEEFCASHRIAVSFISSLNDFGLVEVMVIEDKWVIPESQLQKLEKLVRLHYDLNINLEGIDAIANLLDRLTKLNEENIRLKNQLRLHENKEGNQS